MTPEEDREQVWREVAERFPAFQRRHDSAGNHHAVREIVLGGSVSWATVHRHFHPSPESLVMDIGANAGIFSAFSGVYGAHVVAYEPFAEVFSLLSSAVCDLPVEPINAAIWKYTGRTDYVGNVSTLEGCPAYNGGLCVEGINWEVEAQRAKPVRCVSLEDAVGERIWDCVKMDIEGAEFEVLLAAPEETLRRIRLLYVEFHPWVSDTTYQATLDKLARVFRSNGPFVNPTGRWEAACFLLQ